MHIFVTASGRDFRKLLRNQRTLTAFLLTWHISCMDM